MEALARAAAELAPSRPLYVQNIKMGTRSVTFGHLALSPTDPDTLYVSSHHGFVFGSSDGGLTWNEGRLIVRRRKFYGALRPSPISGGVPFSIRSNLAEIQSQGMLAFAFDDMIMFPYGTFDSAYLELEPDSPAFWQTPSVPGVTSPGMMRVRDSSGDQGDGEDIARLGIGLKTSAKWLARLLRKKKKKPLTMNLQLTLAIKGAEPTSIPHITVHPTRPKVVLAASHMGLWRSTDGGLSWFLVFPGSTRAERRTMFVAYQPGQPDTVFLATGQGLRISRDGAETFQPIKGTQLSTVSTHWVEFAPSDPRVVYAGTNIGAFRSDDSGRTWKWVFFETLPTQNYVTAVAVDPVDPMRVTVATRDGLYTSTAGGRPWKRMGSFLFTGNPVYRLAIDPRDGDRMLCITWRDVWETRDGGRSWQAIYINDSEWSPRGVVFDPRDPGVVWVLTSSEILRLSSRPPTQPSAEGLAALERRLRVEPTLPATMDLTFRHFGVHRGLRGELRERATLRGYVPQVHLLAGYMAVQGQAHLDFSYFQQFESVLQQRQVLGRDERYETPYAFLKLSWDLGTAVYDLETAPIGRLFVDANRTYLSLRFEVQRIYEERRRVLERMLTARPDDLRSRIFLQLRLVELTAHLNAFTNGAWSEAQTWAESLR